MTRAGVAVHPDPHPARAARRGGAVPAAKPRPTQGAHDRTSIARVVASRRPPAFRKAARAARSVAKVRTGTGPSSRDVNAATRRSPRPSRAGSARRARRCNRSRSPRRRYRPSPKLLVTVGLPPSLPPVRTMVSCTSAVRVSTVEVVEPLVVLSSMYFFRSQFPGAGCGQVGLSDVSRRSAELGAAREWLSSPVFLFSRTSTPPTHPRPDIRYSWDIRLCLIAR